MSVDTELFSQEVECIKCFSLRFTDGWYFRISWKLTEANEITPPVLQRNPLWCVLSGRMVKQQRSFCVLLLGVLLKSGLGCISAMNVLVQKYNLDPMWRYLHFHIPWQAEGVNQVRAVGCKFIVYPPSRG